MARKKGKKRILCDMQGQCAAPCHCPQVHFCSIYGLLHQSCCRILLYGSCGSSQPKTFPIYRLVKDVCQTSICTTKFLNWSVPNFPIWKMGGGTIVSFSSLWQNAWGKKNNFKKEMFALAHSFGKLSPWSALSIAFASVVRHNVMEGVHKGKTACLGLARKYGEGEGEWGEEESQYPLLGNTPNDLTSSERPCLLQFQHLP